MNMQLQSHTKPSTINNFVSTQPALSTWGEPESFTNQNHSKPCPIEFLPDTLKNAVLEVVSIVKCPIPLALNSALSVLAVAGQGVANIRPHRNIGASPLSLYLITVAESGERKTTADRFFSAKLSDWMYTQQKVLESDFKKSKANLMAWEREVEGVKQAITQKSRKNEPVHEELNRLETLEITKPKVLQVPNMIFSDSTPEAIAYDLTHKWPCSGILSNEAGVVLGGHGMKAENIIRNLATLNALWEGGSISINRRGEGASFDVRNVRLAMGLGVQPSIIRDFYEQNGVTARGSGFSARFLMAHPVSMQGERALTLAEIETEHQTPHLNQFKDQLITLLNVQLTNAKEGAILDLPELKLSKAALELWLDYYNRIERDLAPNRTYEHYKDIASKSADNVARLAGLFHLIEGNSTDCEVSQHNMNAAVRLGLWYLEESKRFFEEVALPSDLINAIKLDSWLIDYCKTRQAGHIEKSKARQLAPNKLRNIQELNKALEELELRNRIRVSTDETGRRGVIEVNPNLLK